MRREKERERKRKRERERERKKEQERLTKKEERDVWVLPFVCKLEYGKVIYKMKEKTHTCNHKIRPPTQDKHTHTHTHTHIHTRKTNSEHHFSCIFQRTLAWLFYMHDTPLVFSPSPSLKGRLTHFEPHFTLLHLPSDWRSDKVIKKRSFSISFNSIVHRHAKFTSSAGH